MSEEVFDLEHLVQLLTQGNPIVYPTTTLPGLGCIPNSEALDKLYELKGREFTQPVSLAITCLSMVEDKLEWPEELPEMIEAFPPSSISFILPAKTPFEQRLGGENVAIRCVTHPIAVELVQRVGPITATSANPSGVIPSPNCLDAAKSIGLSAEETIEIDCPGGLGSTFVKFEKNQQVDKGWVITIMREGVVPAKEVVSWWMSKRT